jgi:hypothetical protein
MSERDLWPDPVKRVKDEMDFHAVARMAGDGEQGGYAVFSMQDGRPITHDVYPSRREARRMAEKKTTDFLLILEISPDGMPYNEANAVLCYERALNNMGVQSPDALESEENSGILSMPRNRHDRRAMAAQLKSGKPLYPNHVTYGNLPSLRKAK